MTSERIAEFGDDDKQGRWPMNSLRIIIIIIRQKITFRTGTERKCSGKMLH